VLTATPLINNLPEFESKDNLLSDLNKESDVDDPKNAMPDGFLV